MLRREPLRSFSMLIPSGLYRPIPKLRNPTLRTSFPSLRRDRNHPEPMTHSRIRTPVEQALVPPTSCVAQYPTPVILEIAFHIQLISTSFPTPCKCIVRIQPINWPSSLCTHTSTSNDHNASRIRVTPQISNPASYRYLKLRCITTMRCVTAFRGIAIRDQVHFDLGISALRHRTASVPNTPASASN